MLTMLMMAAALAGGASDPPIKSYPGDWALYRNDDDCALMATYNNDSYFRIAYYPGPDKVVLTFGNPAFTGIVSGQKYPLHLMFARNGEVDTHWGVVEGIGADMGKYGGAYFISLPLEVLEDLAQDDYVGLTDDKKPIEKLKIDQLAGPIEDMKQCSRDLAPAKAAPSKT